jgi:hypothetical protein
MKIFPLFNVPHLDAIQNSNIHIKFVHYEVIFVYKIISNWYENVVGSLILKPYSIGRWTYQSNNNVF